MTATFGALFGYPNWSKTITGIGPFTPVASGVFSGAARHGEVIESDERSRKYKERCIDVRCLIDVHCLINIHCLIEVNCLIEGIRALSCRSRHNAAPPRA